MPPRRRGGGGSRVPGTPKPPLTVEDIARAAAMRRYRETRSVSQVELASMLGVSQASIGAYETARTRIPDDIFAELSKVLTDELEVARDAEEANARAAAALGAVDGGGADIPPEVLQALKEANEAVQGSSSPEEAAAKLTGIVSGVAEKSAAQMSKEQRASVQSVKMAYGLLAKVLSRFDPLLGKCVDEDSGALAVSVVEAAEVSPLFARIVAMLAVGPVSNCVLLHVLLIARYDELRAQRAAEQRRQRELEQARQPQEPKPAQVIEQLDPSLGVFGAAAAA